MITYVVSKYIYRNLVLRRRTAYFQEIVCFLPRSVVVPGTYDFFSDYHNFNDIIVEIINY